MKRLIALLFLSFCFRTLGQEWNMSEAGKLTPFIQALNNFSRHIPQEKVYLHFDNTSYYQGDPIWFKCYVTSSQHKLSNLSKTLYVELLNPGGEIIDKRILKIEEGVCHGDFRLSQIPFYSGFYEVRAYTKYMLNFGEEVIFSRLLPVFNKPKIEGDFGEKEMLSYGRWGVGDFPMKRERPLRDKAVNFRFFPEGGNLIQGVETRIAFEATDEVGNPIDITGMVFDGSRQEISSFSSVYQGRGTFTYSPEANTGKQSPIVEVEYSGKKYQFDLPVALPQGVVMKVDNLSHSDSITVTLLKNSDTPAAMLGVAVLHGGKLQRYLLAHIADENEVTFQIDKMQLPSGVSQIAVFNGMGEVLCDRLIFTCKGDDRLEIQVKTGKPTYRPFELVDMDFSVADRNAHPLQTTFSLSVRDGDHEVEGNYNILTDLLLMSEIKGYVRNPLYYFEKDDGERRAALDVLLMVQGWRRYSWKQMAGIEPFEPAFYIEQGLETSGQVVSVVRQKPQPNVDVDMLLVQRAESDKDGDGFIQNFVTDNQGRFSFVSDVTGRWNMILSVSEKGKKKDHLILLDRLFSPEPKRYRYADLQVSMAKKNDETVHFDEEEAPDDEPDDWESLFAAYKDSLSKLGISEQVRQLEAVTVKARRRTQGQDIYQNRSTSVVYYDVRMESDNIYDRGIYVGKDIHELLKNMNPDFSTLMRGSDEWMLYKNRMVLFVVDYERVDWTQRMEIFKYQNINIQAIKSIYINETTSAFCQYYFNPGISCSWAEDRFGCVVFIETYPDSQIPVEGAKGVRKTWLEGYGHAREFYSPNYSELPPEPDYRRTLYWNPMVATDANGVAKIEFYNNSRAKKFNISAETVSTQGIIGAYKRLE